jgi:aryl-alcohol dehydrogenase-like predicted oxidoreductase
MGYVHIAKSVNFTVEHNPILKLNVSILNFKPMEKMYTARAIAWLMARPSVTAPITSATTLAQAEVTI